MHQFRSRLFKFLLQPLDFDAVLCGFLLQLTRELRNLRLPLLFASTGFFLQRGELLFVFHSVSGVLVFHHANSSCVPSFCFVQLAFQICHFRFLVIQLTI